MHIRLPLMSGDSSKSLIKWNKQTIDDFGKKSLKRE
jgi:hypothetical protein